MVKRALIALLMLVCFYSSAAAQDIVGQKLTLLSLASRASETECLWINSSTGVVVKGACPAGDITGVSFTLPSIFDAVSACTTGDCAFTFVLASQSANTIFARSTGAGLPSFQSMTKAMTPATTVHTDQTNTYGAFLQTFGGGLTVSSGTTTTQALSSTTGTFSSTLAVTSTADLKGNISDSTGNLTFNDSADILDNLNLGSAAGEYVRSANYVSRTTGWQADYGGNADFRDLFSDQLKVKLFTVEQTQAVNGSMQWTKSVTELAGESTVAGAVTCPTLGAAETYWFRDFPNAANIRVFQANDYVSIRTLSWADSGTDGAAELNVSDCIGVVTAYADGTAGNDGYQSWTFTRPAGANGGSMAGGTSIPLKVQALNYGVTADGVLEATVTDGSNNVNAPYFGVKKWTTSPIAANFTALARFGQLRGITGTDEYGIFAGPSYNAVNGQFFRASDQNFDLHGIDFSLWDADSANIIMRRNSGNPYFAVGNPAPTTYASGEGIWQGSDSGTYKFRIGNPGGNLLAYDSGTDILSVTGSITAGSGAIGGWSIGTSALTSGSGATTVGLDSGGTNPAIYAGSATPGSAPFRVTNAGAVTATNATVTGSIQTTANCGSASTWCGIFDSNGLKWYDSNNVLRVQLSSTWKGVAVQSSTFSDIYDKEGNFEFMGPSGSVGIFGTTAFENAAHTVKHVKLTTRNAYATGASTKAAYLHITAEGTNTSNATDSETAGGARIELYSAGPSATQTITATAATSIAAVTPIMEVVQDAASANLQATTYIGAGSGLVGVLKSRTAHGTSGSPTQMLSGERYGLVAFEGYATTTGFVASSVINAYATENHTSTARGSYISIGTTHAGTTTRADRVKISSTGGGSPTLDTLAGAWGTGASAYGSFIGSGNNSSGNGAAGNLSMYRRSGTIDYVWSDNAGNLRINSAPPSESLGSPNYDTTTGTVVGTQTSSRRFKNVLHERTDYEAMRNVVLFAPVWDFTYKSGAFGGETFTGITCEDTPEFCMDGGKSLNPANAIGYLIGTIKAQQTEIDDLKTRLARLEALLGGR